MEGLDGIALDQRDCSFLDLPKTLKQSRIACLAPKVPKVINFATFL